MREGEIVEVCYAGRCCKMVVDKDGSIRPLKDGEDGDSVETINLFHPE